MYHLYWTGDPYDNCFLCSGSLEDIAKHILEYPGYSADDLEIYQSSGVDIYSFVAQVRGEVY